MFALSPQSQDGSFTMEWFVGEMPPFGSVVVPPPDERTLFASEAAEVTDPVDGATIFTSGAADGSVRAGLDDDNGLRRFTGIRNGVGELEGLLIEETGWGRRVGDSFTGTIQMSVIEV